MHALVSLDSLIRPTLAAAGSRWALLGEGFALAMVGLVIVFGALFAMGFVLLILRHWGGLDVETDETESPTGDIASGASTPTPTPAPAPAPAPSAAPFGRPATPESAGSEGRDETLDGRTLAILAAAAYTVVGQPVRVQRVHRVTHAREGTDAWARQGRRDIQSSHNLAKRGRL